MFRIRTSLARHRCLRVICTHTSGCDDSYRYHTCCPVADEHALYVLYVRLLAGKYRPPKIQILLTKCDLVKRIDLARRVVMVRHQLDEVRQTCFFLFRDPLPEGAKTSKRAQCADPLF